ncbi:MAG: cytochrome c oxidase subunit 4 [Candidatus Nanopelagicales bacterium]
MKITGMFFAFSAALFYTLGTIYHFVSHEIVGTTALLLTGGLATIVGFYMIFTAKRLGDLPEDQALADVHHADTEYGFFSPHSWWPLPVAASAAVLCLGIVFAAWLVVLGFGLLMVSVTGWLFEYYRGDHLTW